MSSRKPKSQRTRKKRRQASTVEADHSALNISTWTRSEVRVFKSDLVTTNPDRLDSELTPLLADDAVYRFVVGQAAFEKIKNRVTVIFDDYLDPSEGTDELRRHLQHHEHHGSDPVVLKTHAAINGEFLLSLLLGKDEQEAAIGDFLERYVHKVNRLGKLRAGIWAYSDVARAIWPVVRRKLTRIVGIAGAIEWIRRHLT